MILRGNDNHMVVPWETPTFISFEPFLHCVDVRSLKKGLKSSHYLWHDAV